MREVEYKGKLYKDIDEDALKAFQVMNVHTFRYYANDKVWMASDATMKRFGIKKFYTIDTYDAGPGLIYYKDRDIDKGLYTELMRDTSKDKVSAHVRIGDDTGLGYYHIILAVIERNEDGTPALISGLIEDYDDEMHKNAYIQMLSMDYHSIICCDLENNTIDFYKLNEAIRDESEKHINSCKTYEELISGYIEHMVIPDERAYMHKLTSVDNLKKIFKDTNTYRHDYRVLIDGMPHRMRIKIVKTNEDEQLRRIVIGFTEVSQDVRDRLEKLAFYDQVTLGNNYNYFSERIKDVKSEGYIVSLDIKDFKLVNESMGVAVGDKVLREVDELLGRSVPAKGLYAHVNGDHFIVFLPQKKEETVIKTLDKIKKGFEKIIDDNEIPKVSPYYGVAKWTPGSRIQIVFSQANFAKHRIKANGTEYGFYRDEDNAKAVEEKRIEDAFEPALKGNQFEVWYQAKYSPGEKELTGAEALIRWRDPNGGLVSPGKFIPVYERNGMIRKLDEYVFINVCKQQRKWLDEFGCTVPVSVNLSRASLFYDKIVEDYKKIAEDAGILPELVPLEITESAAISNSEIKELSDKFYAAGFPLHIDDFGTGYSSLSTLNLMRFDTLKLDKSLIDYIGEFGGDRLIKHTVALAKDMGLYVTAEGVENYDQVEFLKDVKCDNIQGFFYAKPAPVSDFEQKLVEDKISDKCIYQGGKVYTFSMMLDNVRRAFSEAAAERVSDDFALQISLCGDTEGVMYVEHKKGKISIQPYEYNDRDAEIRIDAFTLNNILKGIGTLENSIRTGRVEYSGDWNVITDFDRIVMKR